MTPEQTQPISTDQPTEDTLTQELADIQEANEAQTETKHITSPEQAEEYLNLIRDLYRQGQGEYRGNPSDEQQLERDLLEAEARELIEGVRMVIEASSSQEAKPADNRDEYYLGSLEFEDMIDAFKQLYVGMATLTYRYAKTNPDFKASGYPKLFDLPDNERALVATQLFYDFQVLNARRFGAEGVGLESQSSKYNEYGVKETTTYDRDRVRGANQSAIDANIAKVASRAEYRQGISMHPAGKLSPDQATDLRKQYSTLNRDDFYKELWTHRDAFEKLYIKYQ